MAKKKRKIDLRLLIIGMVTTMIATLSMLCVPCIMAAYPSLGIFIAFLGALLILLMHYSWIFLVLGVILILAGVALQLSSRKKKCA